jgi:hypothetical protein
METTIPEGVRKLLSGVPLMEYLSRVPSSLPDGRILVHNNVRRSNRMSSSGFRAWLQEPDSSLEPCQCGFAPKLRHPDGWVRPSHDEKNETRSPDARY